MPSRKKRSGKMRAPSPIALVDRVGSAQEAGELAAHLLDRTRTRPVVVISIASGRLEPFIEPEPVAHALGDFAEVVVVPTNEVSWALSRALPDMTQVYGGAGRVYPIGLDWTGDYRLSPLRFAYTAQEGAGAGDLLVEDAIGMAARAGVRQETKTSSRRVSGTVSALFPPTRAFVTLLDGSLATVWQELTTSHAPIDRVLVRGQFVEGMLDDATGRLDISELLRPAAESLDEYQPGAVVLVQVATVTVDAVTVLLHPDVSATIQREQVTTNELDGLDALFSAGEILPARIDARSRLSFELRLDDLDDVDEPLAAPSLMPDGPPWLELPAEEVTVAPGPAEPVRPSPVLPVSALPSSQRPPLSQPPSAAVQVEVRAETPLAVALNEATARIRLLEARAASLAADAENVRSERESWQRRLADAEADLAAVTRQLEQERTRRRTAIVRESRRAQRSRASDGFADRDLDAFTDPVEQFRYEVYLAWTRRIAKSDKNDRPLTEYTVGRRFLASLTALDGVERRKVVDVVVDVLTGLAARLDSRELHKLRVGGGGGSGPVVREDGATCFRVALQRGTPAARRLHFWRGGPGGVIELERVVTHDDVDP